MKIGDKINYLRIQNGYTQKELSDKLGIKQNTLSGYERNVTAVSVNIIEKLADIFGVEKAYFIDEDEIKPIPSKNKMILEDMLDTLIARGTIKDPNDIDKTTIDMLIQIMKKDIEDKIKGQL